MDSPDQMTESCVRGSNLSVVLDGLVTLQRSESGQVLDSILAELYSMPLDELKLVAHAIERIKLHRKEAA